MKMVDKTNVDMKEVINRLFTAGNWKRPTGCRKASVMTFP